MKKVLQRARWIVVPALALAVLIGGLGLSARPASAQCNYYAGICAYPFSYPSTSLYGYGGYASYYPHYYPYSSIYYPYSAYSSYLYNPYSYYASPYSYYPYSGSFWGYPYYGYWWY